MSKEKKQLDLDSIIGLNKTNLEKKGFRFFGEYQIFEVYKNNNVTAIYNKQGDKVVSCYKKFVGGKKDGF